MERNEHVREKVEVPPERLRVVELTEYRELLVSRRRLERLFNKPGWLRDVESNEFFVLESNSELGLAPSV